MKESSTYSIISMDLYIYIYINGYKWENEQLQCVQHVFTLFFWELITFYNHPFVTSVRMHHLTCALDGFDVLLVLPQP